uniref:Uncharacterized protein n=1 Tax=Mycobacterium riyadhense TaxID=486698 RepID=A0A653EUV0_9MYCO|nr:hypothetical protein BIN_B_03903 [Mycobacterium riyadhense]
MTAGDDGVGARPHKWGHLPLAGDEAMRRSGAYDRAGDDAERSDEEERRI